MSTRNSHIFGNDLKSDAIQSGRDMLVTLQSLGDEFLTHGMVTVAVAMFLAGLVLIRLHLA